MRKAYLVDLLVQLGDLISLSLQPGTLGSRQGAQHASVQIRHSALIYRGFSRLVLDCPWEARKCHVLAKNIKGLVAALHWGLWG